MNQKLHFYFPDILNQLRGQLIEPRSDSDTRTISAFQNLQKGFEHFSVKAVQAYATNVLEKAGRPEFEPDRFDELTFPFLQSVQTMRR